MKLESLRGRARAQAGAFFKVPKMILMHGQNWRLTGFPEASDSYMNKHPLERALKMQFLKACLLGTMTQHVNGAYRCACFTRAPDDSHQE